MPKSKGGKRRALCIGINYSDRRHPDTPDELKGCIDDVVTISGLLLASGWNAKDMLIMTDDTPGSLPTRQNIIDACRWLVADAQPGDIFFFSYSGHGSQEEDLRGMEEDGMNETILPLDVRTVGTLSDDHLNELLVRDLPSGCKLLAIIDACHSGSMLDLPHEWTGSKWKVDVNPLYTKGDVQLFSGCSDTETSSDGKRGGAMTSAFVSTLRRNPKGLSYKEMLAGIHLTLRNRGFWQRPCLSSSQLFDPNRPFAIDNILPNRNPRLGRIVKQKFSPPRERPTWMPIVMMGIIGAIFGAAVGYFAVGTMLFVGILATGFGLLGVVSGYCYASWTKSYPIVRYYVLKIPDAFANWRKLLGRMFCPSRRTRGSTGKKSSVKKASRTSAHLGAKKVLGTTPSASTRPKKKPRKKC